MTNTKPSRRYKDYPEVAVTADVEAPTIIVERRIRIAEIHLSDKETGQTMLGAAMQAVSNEIDNKMTDDVVNVRDNIEFVYNNHTFRIEVEPN